MSGVLGERERIDYATTGERQPALGREERDLLGSPQGQRMRAAGEHPGIEQPANIMRRNRAIAVSRGTGLDLDLGATQTQKLPISVDDTVVAGSDKSGGGGLDFNLDLDAAEPKAGSAKPSTPASETSGLDFDLNLDLDKSDSPKADAAKVDLSEISLDLDNVPGDATAKASTDPKWQEVATKLDLAKAYDEMGDKDGARELLREVMKDGDPAQRGSAEQLLAKLS